MPYITTAEQGYENPVDQIQRAAQAAVVGNQMRQQIQQSAQSFPIEQQQRQAQATESTKRAAVIDKSLALQQQAQDLQNQMAKTQLDFANETNPTKKQMLGAQLDQLKGQITNLGFQGQLLQAQAGEAGQRGALYGAEAAKANPGLSPYDITETPGKLDPYGNLTVHKDYTDRATGKIVHSEDSFERGRGVPRVAYKSVFDPQSGQMKRVPGVVQVDPNSGELNVNFPDENEQPSETQRNAVTDGIVSKYFDAETGNPKTTFLGNPIKPSSVADRAQLKLILSNPGLVKEYGLNAYGDLAKTIGGGPSTPSPVATPQETSPNGGAPTPTAKKARPSSVTSSTTSGPGPSPVSGADSAQPSGTTSAAPPVTSPNPADGPQAGISPGGAAVKTGADALPAGGKAKAAAGTPLMSGKKGAAVAAPKKFGDLDVGSVFMQNGVKFRKTGPSSAVPANEEPAEGSSGSETQSLPAAHGM